MSSIQSTTHSHVDPATGVAESGPSAGRTPSSRWPTSRKIGTGLGGLGGLIGAALMVAGIALVSLHGFVRDGDGYYNSGTERLHADQYAITADHIDLGSDPGGPAPTAFLGDLRIKAESADGGSVFVGIGRTAAVERYLKGVGHAELTDFGPTDARYEQRPGDVHPGHPDAQQFWVASSEGGGQQQVEWDAEDGVWSAVIMNADASQGVAVDASGGAQIGWLIWAGIGLAAIGAAVVAGATALIVGAERRAASPQSN